MFNTKDARRLPGRSDEPRVGTVTKLYSNFGYINDDIFFQKHVVIGPSVNIGDTVAANATYHPDLPIKWNAEQVWRVEPEHDEDRRNAHIDRSYSRSYDNRIQRKDNPIGMDDRRNDSRRHSKMEDGRSRSPPFSRNRRHPEHNETGLASVALQYILRPNTISCQLSNIRDLRPADLSSIYPLISPPVYLYRLKCGWQDSFPIHQPFQSSKDVRFHQVNKMAVRLVNVDEHNYKSNPTFAVGVILLGCPPPRSLYEKCVGTMSDTKPRQLTKCINMLTISQDGLRSVGGNWVPELDGSDPSSNPQTLINTAIRTCKDLIGLDLSGCARWYRFLEFRYSRSEGQSWPSMEELFAKGERWGSSVEGSDGAMHSKPMDTTPKKSINTKSAEKTNESTTSASKISKSSSYKSETANDSSKLKPGENATKKTDENFSKKYKENITNKSIPDDSDSLASHRVVVYFMPDIWSIMPNTQQWDKIKVKYQDPNSYVSPKDDKTTNESSDISSATLESDEIATVKSSDASSFKQEPDLKDAVSSPEKSTTPEPSNETDTSDEITQKQKQSQEQPSVDEEDEIPDDPRKLHYTNIDINTMKVSELREQLALRKLDTIGLKAQLSARLKTILDIEAEEEKAVQLKKKEEEKAAKLAAGGTSEVNKTYTHKVLNGASGSKSATDAANKTTGTGSTILADRQDVKLPVLPEQPSLVVQLKQNSAFSLVVCNLETIITLSKGNYKPCNQVYELFIVANHILHMFHRDATFTLYKALVVLSDRKQLLSSHESVIKPSTKTESEQSSKKSKAEDGKSLFPKPSAFSTFIRESATIYSNPNIRSKVIDLPLLFACKLLDYSNRGYFTLYNMETIIGALGLPISRYQVRALTNIAVGDSSRVYYRCLTDGKPELKEEETKDTTSNKNAQRTSTKRPLEPPAVQWPPELNGNPLSVIDDEEYLEELVRGGDAILDEDEVKRLQQMPSLVLCGTPVNGGDEKQNLVAADNFLKHLRRMENECLRLEEMVKAQGSSISSLKKENNEIPKLREKLSKAMSMTDMYKSRYSDRRSTIASALQKLESQACVLETSTQSLRSLSRRLKRDLQRHNDDASRGSESRNSSVAPAQRSNLLAPLPPASPVHILVPETKEATPSLQSQTQITQKYVVDMKSEEEKMEICEAVKPIEVTTDQEKKEGLTNLPPIVVGGEEENVKTNDFNDINSDDSLESAP